MKRRTGNFGAVWTLASFSALGFLACSSPQVAPETDVRANFPVAEHRGFVELPTNTRLNADDLRAQYYRAGRRTLSHVRQRCIVNPPPANCTQTTDVRITAVEGARYIDPADAPKHPQIIAWIENLGEANTFDGIEPMETAIYALVVDSLPTKNPAIKLVRFPGPRAVVRTKAQAADAGRVRPCHSYGQPYISDADFQACDRYPLIGAGALHSLSAHAIFGNASVVVSASASDPTWFSCASGCCSAAAN